MDNDHGEVKKGVQDLSKSVEVLIEKVDTLIDFNREIIKWLLACVIIIALGRSLIEVVKDFVIEEQEVVEAVK